MTTYGLAGRTAFVSGGTSGINLEIALRLAAEGMNVSVFSRTREKVDAAVAAIEASGARACGTCGDVRDYDAVDEAVRATADAFGPIDTVIAGAAGNFLCPAEELSPNGFKAVVDIDLLGTFYTARASFEFLRKPGSSIIAISAGQSLTPLPDQIHANAAKAGVNMTIKTLAAEWGVHGIRANVVIPGPIEDTEGMRRLAPDDAARQHITSAIPLRRYGRKEEVADLVAYLASDNAAYITGAVVTCDGGAALTRGRLSPVRK